MTALTFNRLLFLLSASAANLAFAPVNLAGDCDDNIGRNDLFNIKTALLVIYEYMYMQVYINKCICIYIHSQNVPRRGPLGSAPSRCKREKFEEREPPNKKL